MRGDLIGHSVRVCRNGHLVSGDNHVRLSGCGHVRARRVGGACHQRIGTGCGDRGHVVRTHRNIMRGSLIVHIDRVCRNGRLIGGNGCIRLSGCGHVRARRVGGTRHQRIGIGCCGRSRVVRIHRSIVRGDLIGHIGRVCRNAYLVGDDGRVRLSSYSHVHARRVGGSRHQRIGIGCDDHGNVIRIHRRIVRGDLISHIGRVCRNVRLDSGDGRVRLSGCGRVRARRVGGARHQCIGIGCCGRSCIIRIHRRIMRGALIGHISRVCCNNRLVGGNNRVRLSSCGHIRARHVGDARHQRISIGCDDRGRVVRIHRRIMRGALIGHISHVCRNGRLIGGNSRVCQPS